MVTDWLVFQKGRLSLVSWFSERQSCHWLAGLCRTDWLAFQEGWAVADWLGALRKPVSCWEAVKWTRISKHSPCEFFRVAGIPLAWSWEDRPSSSHACNHNTRGGPPSPRRQL